jgi:hypothetical protein
MRSTPRQIRSSRGVGTLIGNGWLREAAPNAWPGSRWDIRSKSALRKCMFLPVPDELLRLAPHVSPAALPAPAPYAPPERKADAGEIAVYRGDPRKHAGVHRAYVPGQNDPRAAQQARAVHMQNAQKVAVAAAAAGPSAWWEDPVALGSLLILVPPIGLAAVWSSKRYSSDARWALTVMTALTMCLMSAVTIAALAMH